GSGELGKEVVIEAQRLGVEVIAVDRYPTAPAMQVAHRSHVIDMTDAKAVRAIVEEEDPALIVPEIEAIATDELSRLEEEGYNVIPTARATKLTMDREGIRRFVAEELGVRTSPYAFADSLETYKAAVEEVGLPCVVKPTMSSSGKGQSIVESPEEVDEAWRVAQEGTRADTGRIIVEGFVPFDYEITLLTVRHVGGTSFCPPIGHRQEDGDYRTSWQPMPMNEEALAEAQEMAAKVTDGLGGYGIFGVEFFVMGDEVFFSELSPRPHDTGLVTLTSQNMSEFELHVRAILGLPIPEIELVSPGASAVILSEVASNAPGFTGVADALAQPGTLVRLFGKPKAYPDRRMGVVVAKGENVEDARDLAEASAGKVQVIDDA
ncbi:MAG: formate-dependent phosphoribosylglycinamide formyltransferase, partial [Candidatus Thermoplasmatota archaeon]|nr:formate-dependent phosphoribosylglycinamide formyltransferase [Candidatus Thermoplasmatota archaeon]